MRASDSTDGSRGAARDDAAAAPVLELDRATVAAPAAGAAVEVLRDISLSIGRGRVVGLVGESGAGKSMIGKLVAGLLPPGFALVGGEVRFRGERLAGPRRRLLGRDIAFVPQEPLSALNPVLTIGRQFAEHLQRLGVAAREREGAAAQALREVGLTDGADLLRRYPHELSGGQCQRVLIALAFASNPALVIADEPTSALDVVSQAHIMRVLASEQRTHGTAVLLITHDLRLAAHVCDEVAVMYAGDLVEVGKAGVVLRQPLHPYTRALRDAVPPLRGPLRALPASGEHMPGLAAIAGMAGCRFAPRCPVRDERCVAGLIGLAEMAPGHSVRCAPACAAGLAAAVPPDAAAPLPSTASLSTAAPLSTRELAAASQLAAAPIIEFAKVDLAYPREGGWLGKRPAPLQAVRSASFRIFSGETVGIVGESGSGKSSIARLALGLERPTAGSVLLDGQPARGPREGVQIVFQDPQSALNPRRRVLELVTQALEASRLAVTADRPARAAALARDTGLPQDCLGRFPAQLSGGQRQRVNIARALCVTPRLLVADEIVSGLDVSVQAQILNLLAGLTASLGLALLFISHDLAVIRYLCTRVLVMCRGEIVEGGATAELFARPQHPYTRALLAAVPPEEADRPWPPPAEDIAA
jgi:peptide/nickel transport system ATP-binding protein